MNRSKHSWVGNLTGAIFDCDGILIDSEQPWIDLMTDYLHHLGARDFPAETLRGLTAAEAVASLVRIHSRAGATSGVQPPTAEEVDRAYSAALENLSAPMVGAPEFVASLAGTIPLAVASNGRGVDVRGLLERAGMLELFDTVVTIDDVARGKPEPDPYLMAAERLGVAPASAVAFEDSIVGSQAARAAGCTVFGINDDPAVPLVADIRLTNFGQLSFDLRTRSLRVNAG